MFGVFGDCSLLPMEDKIELRYCVRCQKAESQTKVPMLRVLTLIAAVPLTGGCASSVVVRKTHVERQQNLKRRQGDI